jgi:hypothetical protein
MIYMQRKWCSCNDDDGICTISVEFVERKPWKGWNRIRKLRRVGGGLLANYTGLGRSAIESQVRVRIDNSPPGEAYPGSKNFDESQIAEWATKCLSAVFSRKLNFSVAISYVRFPRLVTCLCFK